ncbi:hypothetical protein [Halovivax cerinus]|uniref:Uncharacterized protein n=1 Tax=Halovivax cerinus TaxID=1487865 RepID=A0ABD5NQY0_9EURY|nr:hypothetical protein [Halovivax cerinus]
MTTIDIEGDTLVVGDTKFRFRHPVKETADKGDVVIVLLDVPVGEIDNRNVIGVSKDGDRLWEIEPISDDPTRDQAYVSLYERGGDVWVGNPIGAECKVDARTGSFLEKRTKRW